MFETVRPSVMAFSGAGTFFPSDGNGGNRPTARATSVGATSVYDDTGVVDAATNWSGAGVIVGDYVFTSDNYYGWVTAVVAGAGGRLSVKEWKFARRFNASTVTGRPASGVATTTAYPSVILQTYEKVTIESLSWNAGVVGTIAIGDQKGVAVPGHAYIIKATDPPDTIPIDFAVDSPFCIIVTTAGSGNVKFRAER